MNQPQVFLLERSLRLASGLPVSDVIEMYAQTQEGLLILGEAGCGKTTQLLLLTKYLLEKAEQALNNPQNQQAIPIPVIFLLSSWTKKQHNLVDWLVDELQTKYNLAPHIGRPWIENGAIQPFLDGLDEVDPADQEACIKQINHYQQSHGLMPIVVSCRTEHYVRQKTPLLLESVGEIQPLTPLTIDLYLAEASQGPSGEPLAKLQDALQKDSVLRELFSTPLMLQIGVKAYFDSKSTGGWYRGSLEERRNYIFTIYIGQMLGRRLSRHYPPKRSISWLAWLADQLHHKGESAFSPEGIDPDWFPQSARSWWRLSPLLGTNLLIIAALLLLMFAFHNTTAYILSGVGVFLLPGIALSAFYDERFIIPLHGIWRAVRRSILFGVFGGLIVGGLSAFVWGQGYQLLVGIYSGLFLGLFPGGLGILCFKYASIRFCLWRDGYKPFNYSSFLDYAVDCRLLNRLGNGYIFLHPLLLAHFASLNTAPITDWREIEYWNYKASSTLEA